MKFALTKHKCDIPYCEYPCEPLCSIPEDLAKIRPNPLGYVTSATSFDQIVWTMQDDYRTHNERNAWRPDYQTKIPSREEIASGLIRLIELGYVYVVDR